MGNVSPTITTDTTPSVIEKFTYEIDGKKYLIRIRKLTPRECWRLMDFSDEDFDKAAAVNSNSQLYKEAGNSIVKNVLVAVFGQLFEGHENDYRKNEDEIAGKPTERDLKGNEPRNLTEELLWQRSMLCRIEEELFDLNKKLGV